MERPVPGHGYMTLSVQHTADVVQIVLIDRQPASYYSGNRVVIGEYGPLSDPEASLHFATNSSVELTAEELCRLTLVHMSRREGPRMEELVHDRFWQIFIDDLKALSTISHVNGS